MHDFLAILSNHLKLFSSVEDHNVDSLFDLYLTRDFAVCRVSS